MWKYITLQFLINCSVSFWNNFAIIVDQHVTTARSYFTNLMEDSNVLDTLLTQCQILLQKFLYYSSFIVTNINSESLHQHVLQP